MNDPQATATEIQAISVKSPKDALMHPNCPVDLWWNLAVKYPALAIKSTAYDLMTLEAGHDLYFAVISNCAASPESIAWLSGHDERAALSHPNCPEGLWFDLAYRHLDLYEDTPVYTLFLFTDPTKMMALDKHKR